MSKNKYLAALPLGGVGEIGMNLMVYECDGNYIVVDAGVSFGDDSTPGVDVIVPDTRFLREHAKNIKGFFLTHAHEDHVGGVGYLWDDITGAPHSNAPVFASPFGRLVIEGKLQELGIKPGKNQLKTAKAGEKYKVGPFEVEYVPVFHSIPEAHALAIHTPYGTIIHTGDYKFDDNAPFGHKTDEKRFAELGKEGVLAILGDSTNSMNPTPGKSEEPVVEHLSQLVRETKGRVVFAAFASHIGRTLKIAEVAVQQGRKVCFLGRTVNKMISHSKQLGFWPKSLNNWVVEAEEISGLPEDKVFIFASGTQGESGSSLTRLSQGQEVRGIKLKKEDTIILSSRMIPGNERGILNVINGLSSLGAHIVSELNDKNIHVSGHAHAQEILRLYKLVKPQYVVPVHGEPMQLRAHAELAEANGYKSLGVRDGQKLVLASQEEGFKPGVQGHTYPHGKNYIDGLNILDNDATIMKDRKKLAFEGIVTAALALRASNGEWVSDISITSRGVLDERLQAYVLQTASEKAAQALEAIFRDGLIDDRSKASEIIQQAIRRVIKQERGKTPPILVHFVEV